MHTAKTIKEHKTNPSPGSRYGSAIPDHVVDDIARCLLPKIQSYFETPEGKAAFEEWKNRKDNT